MGEWHLFGGLTYDPRRRPSTRTMRPQSSDAIWRPPPRPSSSRSSTVPIAPGVDVAKHHVLSWLAAAPKVLGGREVEAAVVAIESHKNGWPHFHPLLRIAGGLTGDEIAPLGALWFERHGYAKLEVPRDVEDTAAYAAKYLSKDLARGDVVFWPTRGPLDRHQPGL